MFKCLSLLLDHFFLIYDAYFFFIQYLTSQFNLLKYLSDFSFMLNDVCCLCLFLQKYPDLWAMYDARFPSLLVFHLLRLDSNYLVTRTSKWLLLCYMILLGYWFCIGLFIGCPVWNTLHIIFFSDVMLFYSLEK